MLRSTATPYRTEVQPRPDMKQSATRRPSPTFVPSARSPYHPLVSNLNAPKAAGDSLV
jgi:hypothetical protein